MRIGLLGFGLSALAGLRGQTPPSEPAPSPAPESTPAPEDVPAPAVDAIPDGMPAPTAGSESAPMLPPSIDPNALTGENEPLPPQISLSRFPWTTGNRVGLLVDGAQAFGPMLEAARGAQSTLLVESYIFGDDEVGRAMIEIMKDRARHGVQVRLILDGLGREEFTDAELKPLLDAGARYITYRRVRPWHKLWPLWLFGRDHRKMVIVDGRRAFIGGINLRDVEKNWHDFVIEIEGPAVTHAAKLFATLWREQTRQALDAGLFFPDPPLAGSTSVRVLGNRQRAARWEIYAAYREALRAAKREVIIANSYFIPDRWVRRELYKAVQRGVRVILILPGDSDIPVVQAASEHKYRDMLRHGIEIYQYNENVLHAKVAVIDGHWLTVGSYNIDHLSLKKNLEVTAVVQDAELGGQLRAVLIADMKKSKPVVLAEWEKRPWTKKLKSGWCYRFRNFM